MTSETKKKVKKPKFSRQDSHKKKRLGEKWRKPKGLQSKMRLHKKGYNVSVKTGYGTDKKTKYLMKGLQKVTVNNVDELRNIDEKKQGIIISKKVGKRKRIEIIKEAEKNKIKILNIKSPQDYVKQVEERRTKDKEKKESKKKQKEEKKKEKPKKETKSIEEKLEKEMTEEEIKEQAKREKDKVLTKKE